MPGIIERYTKWLHTQWPAGTVEKLPDSGEDGATALPGVRIVGDLTGIPLLKFSSDTGARAVRAILREPEFARREGANGKGEGDLLDLAIIGAGVSGISAAIEAKKAGLRFAVFEAAQVFSTVANFPKGKPIYTYPTEMRLEGGLQFHANVKEALLAEMEEQRRAAGIEVTPARIERVESRGRGKELLLHHGDKEKTVTRARRVIIAIGRSGNHRKLGCHGEDLDKVYNRLFDPKEFSGKNVLVVGGGDSALESAIALAGCGAHVTVGYRKPEFARPKPENVEKLNALVRDPKADVQVEKPTSERVNTALTRKMVESTPDGSITLALATQVVKIEASQVTLKKADGSLMTLSNDVVFSMIGREAPLDFFRRSGLHVRGDWRASTWISCIAFVLFCVLLYHWKSNHPREFPVQQYFAGHQWFPAHAPAILDAAGGTIAEWSNRPGNLLYTVKRGLSNPSFYYTLAYCTCVLVFGIRRIKRRRTPYVTRQTIVLICSQCIPLFILPEIILPWAGRNGFFEQHSPLRWLADNLFESYDGSLGHERAYWRAYGFILAWPLNVYNVFTPHPMWLWLGISFVQTFVIIPLIIFRWGKGAYCGWICSCGALAETMGINIGQRCRTVPFGTGSTWLVRSRLLLLLQSSGCASPAGFWGRVPGRRVGTRSSSKASRS